MKLTRLIAAVAAAMLFAAGCTARNLNGETNNVVPPVTEVPPVTAAPVPIPNNDVIEDENTVFDQDVSRIENDISAEQGAGARNRGFNDNKDNRDTIDRMNPHILDGTSPYIYDSSRYDADRWRTAREASEQMNNHSVKRTDRSVPVAAMSTDFSEIGALDATMDNGFPGGPTDDQNRPGGPLAYQKKYGEYDAYFIVADSKKIYLTFDEGYENGYTSEILDTLKDKGVKAVFFITYPYAQTEKELVKRMVDEGHTLGNHSSAHKNFTTMPLEEAAKDILKLHDYVKANYGYEMFLFRPPEGAFSEQTLALTQKLGYKTVLWSFAYKDWEVDDQPITIEAIDKIVSKAHPGEIALLHAVSKTNAEILGDVIDRLRDEGFEFASYFGFS